MKTLFAALLLTISGISCARQNKGIHNYSVVKPDEWIIPNSGGVSYKLGAYEGSEALLIKKNFGNYKFGAVAYPKGLTFTDGEIELDLASTTGTEYLGFAFRIKDAHHYETVYFRPASSGTINAIQYMPEKKSEFNWWDFEDAKHQAKTTLPAKTWFHVKAVVKGRQLTVYVNHQDKPAMVYNGLDPELKSGFVGFWFGNNLECAYKNLVIKTY